MLNSWNSKEASHESFFSHLQLSGIRRKPRTKASFSWIIDAIWMLGFERNIVFFSGLNGGSVVEKSWFARDGLRRRRFGFDSCSFCARSGTNGSRWLFLFFDDAVLLFCMCWNTLCNGTGALKRCVHFLTSWNLKEVSHESFVFTSSTLGIWRKSRTQNLRQELRSSGKMMEVCRSSYRQNVFLDPTALHFLNLETAATRLAGFYL